MTSKHRILTVRDVGMFMISLIFTAIVASFFLPKDRVDLVGPVTPLRTWEAK